jgi:hypothetical protein
VGGTTTGSKTKYGQDIWRTAVRMGGGGTTVRTVGDTRVGGIIKKLPV